MLRVRRWIVVVLVAFFAVTHSQTALAQIRTPLTLGDIEEAPSASRRSQSSTYYDDLPAYNLMARLSSRARHGGRSLLRSCESGSYQESPGRPRRGE